MLRAVSYFLTIFVLLFNIGCGSTPSANGTQSNNSNMATNSTSVNVSTVKSPAPSNTSSLNTPVSQKPSLADVANSGPVVRTIKPGEKIPGIPDAATIKRQMSTPVDPSKLPPEFRRALNTQSNANAASSTMKKRPQ